MVCQSTLTQQNNLHSHGLPPEYFKSISTAQKIHLKCGAKVMLLTNIDLKRELSNGIIGEVIGFTNVELPSFIQSKWQSESYSRIERPRDLKMPLKYLRSICAWAVNNNLLAPEAQSIRLPVVKFFISKGPIEIVVKPVVFDQITRQPDGRTLIVQRVQLPLALAWAVTIHKSQGRTITAVDLDIDGAFAAGQGYVGLSRVSTSKNLQISGKKDKSWEKLLWTDPEVRKFYQWMEKEEERQKEERIGRKKERGIRGWLTRSRLSWGRHS